MTVTDFLQSTGQRLSEHGLSGVRYAAENFLRGFAVRTYMWGETVAGEETILDGDWDLFIVLDACRYDLMAEVADEYDFEVAARTSYAASSQDWLQKTFYEGPTSLQWLRVAPSLFRDPYQNALLASALDLRPVDDVAYITGNPQSSMLDGDAFHNLDEPWQEDWDRNDGFLDPRVLTDRTIDYLRRESPEQTIVHYMQPHEPFRGLPDADGTVWRQLQEGRITHDEMWEAYLDNLRWVLDEVEILLENVDAERVVVSADHGNSLGEYGFYGHRPYLPLAGMLEVPWIETTASEEGTHDPEIRAGDADHDAEELLEDLGYR
jgi:hypothetical protein